MARGKKSKKIWLLLFVILLCLIAGAVAFVRKAGAEKTLDEAYAMTTNAERVAFLNEQGWIVKPDPISTEEVTIPTEWGSDFADYLALEKSQGFDLEKYAGETAEVFTYSVLNYPDFPENITANMIVKDGRLIGGEIMQNTEGGFIQALVTRSYTEALPEETAVTEMTTTAPSTTVSAVVPTITVTATDTSVPPQTEVYLEDVAARAEVFP
ncbi:MAG: DUF4830 domain-containing protein [Ruminococcus sp.]|jgi:hypothetical protein|nr:DUF4830 domain-containing protein [Ruminococcus sp.]